MKKAGVRESVKNTIRVSFEVIKLIWNTSRYYTILTTILLVFAAVIPIAQAYFVKMIIDGLTQSLKTTIPFSSILFYLGLFIGAMLLSRVIDNGRNASQIILGNLFTKYINQRVVKKTGSMPFSRFEDAEFYDKLDRIRQQATWRPLNTFYGLYGGFRASISLISVIVVLFTLKPVFVGLMILFSVPSLWVQIKFGNVWWNLIHRETSDSRKLNYYQHLLGNRHEMKDIKLLDIRNHLLSKYKKLYDKMFEEQKEVVLGRFFWEFITYLFADVVYIAFYVFVTWQTYMRKITIGDFTFYTSMYNQATSSLSSIVHNTAEIYKNNLFISDLLEFFSLKEEKDAKGSIAPALKTGFEFKDVWFKYPGTDQWILKGISFTLPLKKTIALVGENGAGKSTIVKLLTRLYTPTKGQILLGGVPIEDMHLKKYRKLFGIAFQDFANFNFTVKENIEFGDIHRKIPRKEIVSISRKTQIYKKIMSMPQKFNTFLGRWFKDGQELSYGEWQRLAIARTLIRKAPVYILDEPTAALDAKAEYNVFRQFKAHVRGKTALFISHRFSNVRLADTILVLEYGKIIQQGSHRLLMRKRGRYRELYNFQAKRYK